MALVRSRYILGPQYDSAPNVCAYCGVRASHEEHVIPISSMVNMLGNQNLKSWVVPSCDECNLLLGSKIEENMFFTSPKQQFLIKRRLIRDILRARYFGKGLKKIGKAIWTEDELSNSKINPGDNEDLDKVSYRMATFINQSYTKEEIEARLYYDCFDWATPNNCY